MKNKKGFTLVEVLLVIIVLGVLFSIAVPSISLVIEKSKLNSSLLSAKNYIAGIEYKFLNNVEDDEVKWWFVGNSSLSDVLKSGDYPQDGVVTMYKNKVVEAKLCFFGKSISYSNGEYVTSDDDEYCDYTANAIANINLQDNSETQNINYDELKVNTSVLTEETKIFGLEYINPDYLEYEEFLETNPEEARKIENIPAPYILNNGELELLKEGAVLAQNSKNNNVSFMSNGVQKVASVNDSYYNLNLAGYGTRIENQKDTGLCWAFASTSMLETTFQKKVNKLKQIQFSPRHLDYFLAKDSISNLNANNYSLDRTIADGGSFWSVLQAMFTGLTIQEVSDFGDDYSLDKKTVSEVFDKEKIDYYVKKASLLGYEYSDFAKNKVKQAILDNGGIYGGICAYNLDWSLGLKPIVGATVPAIITGEDPENIQDCGSHAVMIIGWDDSVGAWIAQNSWGVLNPFDYLYIDYEYDRIYKSIGYFEEIATKNWDNSYDSKNNFDEFVETIQYGDDPEIYVNNIYIDKVNGNKEKITDIGYKKMDSSYESDMDLYFLSASDKQNCVDVSKNLVANRYRITNNKIYSGSNQIGFVVKTPTLNEFGFVINDNTDTIEFENDICIVAGNYSIWGDSYIPELSIFTKNVENTKIPKIEINVKNMPESNLYYNVDTYVSNVKSGSTINYTIVDSNGKNVAGTGEVIIKNNVVVNNVAHTEFEFKRAYQYKITANVDSVTSNTVIINEGNLKSKPVTNRSDKTSPSCSWVSASYKVTNTKSATFYLTCYDASGFSDTTIKKSDISVSGLIKKLEVSVSPVSLSKDGRTAKWVITLKRKGSVSGSSTITLKKNVISDKKGNKNTSLKSRSIKVSSK